MHEDVFIHVTAEVSERAIIGLHTKIWNLVQIRENAEIGSNCILSKNVYVDFGVRIGNNVKIQNNVSVYHGVTIEDDVFVGPAAVFTNDFLPRSVNPDWQITPTLIKRGASIGANATIVCGTVIGECAMVAAGSVVTKSVGPHCLVAGNPAKPIAFVYRNGNKVAAEHVIGANETNVHFRHPESGEELSLEKASLRLVPVSL